MMVTRVLKTNGEVFVKSGFDDFFIIFFHHLVPVSAPIVDHLRLIRW